MRTYLRCISCGMDYCLPDLEKMVFEDMRVVSEPFSDGKHVWFWSEKDNNLYLNLSCKKELDLVFLHSGQVVTSCGKIRLKDVHVKLGCPACGHEMEIDGEIPCLINTDTKIKLMQVS